MPEFYTSNYVSAITFHDIPHCSNNCTGCYLKPHNERYNSSPQAPARLGEIVIKAWNDLLDPEYPFKCGLVTFAANTNTSLRYYMSAADHNREIPAVQILATKDTWDGRSMEAYSIAKKNKILIAQSYDEYKNSPDTWEKLIYGGYLNQTHHMHLLATGPMLGYLEKRLRGVPIPNKGEPYPIRYLIAHKPITGLLPSPLQIENIQRLVKVYKQSQNYPRHNYVLDRCIKHMLETRTEEMLSQGFEPVHCGAGINFFSVHADGVITGCPYSMNVLTSLQNHGGDIGKAINYVRDMIAAYPYRSAWTACKLRNINLRYGLD